MSETESRNDTAPDSGKDAMPIAPLPGAGSLDAISKSITGSMSKPTEAAPAVGSNSGASSLTDAEGRGFDPDFHITDELGQPVKNSKGLLKKRPGRKKSKQRAGASHSHVGPRPADPIPELGAGLDEKQRMNALITGKGAAGAFLMVAASLGGEEWLPRTTGGINERQILEGAFADYCTAKGFTDIPPGVALFAAMMMYAAPRFTMPRTKTKLQRAALWLRTKFRKRNSGGTQSDPRDDRERQNDAGKKAGA